MILAFQREPGRVPNLIRVYYPKAGERIRTGEVVKVYDWIRMTTLFHSHLEESHMLLRGQRMLAIGHVTAVHADHYEAEMRMR